MDYHALLQGISPTWGLDPNFLCLLHWEVDSLPLHHQGDLPGGAVVKNPPSNAGDPGSIPGRGTKIPHATGQLSPCATTREARVLN